MINVLHNGQKPNIIKDNTYITKVAQIAHHQYLILKGHRNTMIMML